MPDLLERVLAIADAFDSREIPHSFGGAIALGFYAEVRLTHDIDINVYLESESADVALTALAELGVEEADADQREAIRRDAQTRLRWDGTPIDVLSPEDLIVCKVAFAREKDARDIDTMLDARGDSLDLRYVQPWVDEIVGSDAPSVLRLSKALKARSLTMRS